MTSAAATVEVFAHVRDLPADAQTLMGRAERHHVEFGVDWYANLIDAVFAREPAQQVRILVLRQAGRVLAVLPTVARKAGPDREVGALSNFYTAIYAPAVEEGVTARDLLPLTRALRQGGDGAPAYRFSPMDPASREFGLFRHALDLAGLKARSYFAFGNWYEPVRLNWADYLKERSGQVRNTIKRNAKKFAAEGGSLEIVRDGERLEAGIAAYHAVYSQSWKVPEPYPDFVPGLIRLCARRGWLRLGVAWVKDKPVAAQIWIVAHGRADIYKLAYDEVYKALAPGTLLTAALMEEALDVDGVQEIDYLIGDDPYKAAWMSQRRERFGLIAYDPLTPRGLIGLIRQMAGDGWRRLRAAAPPRPDNSPRT